MMLLGSSLHAQDSLSDADALNAGAFDKAVSAGAKTDSLNKLQYLPGIFFVADESGYYFPASGTYGSDARFYGKAFVKVSKADIGALYAGCNYNYFLYAASSNETFRAFYQLQSPNPTQLSASLSELHFSFDIKKTVFVRLGDQLISWGSTYFWTPEDFINQQKAQATILSVVDIRSGKPGVRIHVPLKNANIILFTDFSSVVKNGVPGGLAQNVGQAWRIDGTIGGVNIGTVGYVSKNNPAKIGFDATGNLLGADLYGELALTFTNSERSAPDYALSAGASRAFGQEKTWTARAEVYYNSTGYKDTDLSLLAPGAFTPFYSGRYYAYAELTTTKLVTSILGASLFGFANLGDLSYSSTLQFNLDFPGVLPFSVFARYYGGKKNREFTTAFGGDALQFGLRIHGEF
jgi:hypothetical protein